MRVKEEFHSYPCTGTNPHDAGARMIWNSVDAEVEVNLGVAVQAKSCAGLKKAARGADIPNLALEKGFGEEDESLGSSMASIARSATTLGLGDRDRIFGWLKQLRGHVGLLPGSGYEIHW